MLHTIPPNTWLCQSPSWNDLFAQKRNLFLEAKQGCLLNDLLRAKMCCFNPTMRKQWVGVIRWAIHTNRQTAREMNRRTFPFCLFKFDHGPLCAPSRQSLTSGAGQLSLLHVLGDVCIDWPAWLESWPGAGSPAVLGWSINGWQAMGWMGPQRRGRAWTQQSAQQKWEEWIERFR